MGYRIIKAPPEGDCFFHVVAHFLGGSITSIEAAKAIRKRLAETAALILFKPPHNNLETLTNLVVESSSYDNLVVVELTGTVFQIDLLARFNQGPAAGQGNGGSSPIQVFVTWLQYDVAEISKCKSHFSDHWTKAAYNSMQYTIWGDDLFCRFLVENCYNKQCRFYTPATIDGNEHFPAIDDKDDVVNLYFTNNHWDAVEYQEEDVETEPKSSIYDEFGEGPVPHRDNLQIEVHHIDVGQGDCTLILVKNKSRIIQSVLIDGGDSGQAPLVHEYMNRAGVNNLDWIIITHFDKDHARGILELLANSSICQNSKLFDRGIPDDVGIGDKVDRVIFQEKTPTGEYANIEDDRIFEDEVEELRNLLLARVKVHATANMRDNQVVGHKLFEISNTEEGIHVYLQCIAGNGYINNNDYVPPLHSDRENSKSLNFLLRFNTFTYYIGGDSPGVQNNDLEGAVAKYMTEDLGLEHICGLRVNHHGSHHSTKRDFVEAIDPTVAFISTGINRKFCHPHQSPITNLTATDSVQNFYLTNCGFKRTDITPFGKFQIGKSRVAGDEATLGTIILRIDHSLVAEHIFYVGYWDKERASWCQMRHVCGFEDLCEELLPNEAQQEDVTVFNCQYQSSGEYIEQIVLLADAVQKARAEEDVSLVRSFGMSKREHVRCLLTGNEIVEPRETKTMETVEMLNNLDARCEEECNKVEEEEYEKYDEYVPSDQEDD